MNMRKLFYSIYSYAQGRNLFKYYNQFLRETNTKIPNNTTQNLLIKLLRYSHMSVPYYAEMMNQINERELLEYQPEMYLQKLPILTKDIIRKNFEQLKSQDIAYRSWYFQKSGGSTGEPLEIIQDQEFLDQTVAIKLLYSYLVSGRDLGEPEVHLWSSERDILGSKIGWKKPISNFLQNTTYINAFQKIDADRAREFMQLLKQKQPKLIIAYSQAMYALAKLVEAEKLKVVPQKAIITTAETLHPWMREKIESVFQCRVYNRYGSREVGDIACERPGYHGLWIAPWGNYVEIVDDNDRPVPPGVEGNIIVTCLINFAMPLIRYKIGDRGILSPHSNDSAQILEQVSGRIVDNFKTSKGDIIPGGYFIQLLAVVFNNDRIKKFQVIQKSYNLIHIKIILNELGNKSQFDFSLINEKIKNVMGKDCDIKVEFVDDIASSISGKYRYTISEVI